jgi:hypothetical protein
MRLLSRPLEFRSITQITRFSTACRKVKFQYVNSDMCSFFTYCLWGLKVQPTVFTHVPTFVAADTTGTSAAVRVHQLRNRTKQLKKLSRLPNFAA